MRILKTAIFAVAMLAVLLGSLAPAAYAADLNGKWTFVFSLDDGDRVFPVELNVSGEKAVLKFSEEMKVEGTYIDGTLKVAGKVYSEEAGHEGNFQLTGKLDGEKLAGEAQFDDIYMKFSGTRRTE